MLPFCSLQILKFCLLLFHAALVCRFHFDNTEPATTEQAQALIAVAINTET
jgi:hypothetical protein